jgi:hypothetical protein
LLKSEDVGGNLLLKVVVFDIDMLCAFGGSFAPGHVDSALVVYAEGDNCGLRGSGDVTEWPPAIDGGGDGEGVS